MVYQNIHIYKTKTEKVNLIGDHKDQAFISNLSYKVASLLKNVWLILNMWNKLVSHKFKASLLRFRFTMY